MSKKECKIDEGEVCKHPEIQLHEERIHENTYKVDKDGGYNLDSSYCDDGWLVEDGTATCRVCKAEWKGDDAKKLYAFLENSYYREKGKEPISITKLPEPTNCKED